jgi:hypothetical protein
MRNGSSYFPFCKRNVCRCAPEKNAPGSIHIKAQQVFFRNDADRISFGQVHQKAEIDIKARYHQKIDDQQEGKIAGGAGFKEPVFLPPFNFHF